MTIEAERLAKAMWDAWADEGQLRIDADSWKELTDLAASVVAKYGTGSGPFDVERLARALSMEAFPLDEQTWDYGEFIGLATPRQAAEAIIQMWDMTPPPPPQGEG